MKQTIPGAGKKLRVR